MIALRKFIFALVVTALTAFAMSNLAFAQDKSAVQSRVVDVNGIKMYYLVAGKGDPVVLLHGFAETSHMWRPLIAELAKNHEVIAPDLRGFGSTSAPESGYTKKEMAQDVHALVKSLGYSQIRLVGHDIGLMAAYAYAAQYPGEVERLVLWKRSCQVSANGITSFCCAISGISISTARRRWRWSPAANGFISNISGPISPPIQKNRYLKRIANSTPRPMPSPAT